MPVNGRKVVQITKYLLTGVTIFCVSWIACVSEWHGGVQWGGQERWGPSHAAPTMRTIVAYSEGKQAEMDRPYPVTCDRLPAYPKVPIINHTWSGSSWDGRSAWQPVPGANVTLYRAYYDDRFKTPFIRILAMFPGHKYSNTEPLYCQTRFKGQDNTEDPDVASIEVVAAKVEEIWFPPWDAKSEYIETPLLLSCPLTEPLEGLTIVSVVTETCHDPKNAFIVEPTTKNMDYERKFTVCVKDLTFEKDISRNLVEWIETNRVLGVDKIDMYVDKVHKTTEGILEYYREKGFLRLFNVPINHPKQVWDNLWQRRRDHVITFNDCLYRNIKESEFIIPLDIDEIILPKIADNLLGLTERLIKTGWKPSHQSALVQNMFFFDFIQNSDNFVTNTSNANDSELLSKRDNLQLGSDKNLDSKYIYLSNDVVDTDILSEKYRLKCGKDLVVPKLLHHMTRSAHIGAKYAYCKSLMVTKHVMMAFNHFPLFTYNRIGSEFIGRPGHWFAPVSEVQLNHYKESCNPKLVSCDKYERRTVRDDAALRLRRPIMQALADGPCLPAIN